jgi:hypothetical protein
MKHLLLLLVFLGAARLCYCQTWLSPVVGYDIANMRSQSGPPQYLVSGIVDTGFAVHSLVWGARVDQQLGQKFFLAYQFGYSEKMVRAFLFGIVPYDGFKFQQYRNTVVFRYFPNSFVHVSLGGNLFIMKNGYMIPTYAKDYQGTLVTDFSLDKGLQLAIGGHFKQLELELFYHHGLSKPKNFRVIEVLPIRSVGASLSYRFKVLGRKKGR